MAGRGEPSPALQTAIVAGGLALAFIVALLGLDAWRAV